MAQAEVHLGPGVRLPVGPNASGKTSLLEAVCVIATTKSSRTAQDEELIRWGPQSTLVEGKVAREKRGPLVAVVRIVRRPDEAGTGTQKTVTLHGVRQRSAREAIGETAVAMLGPDDLGLVKRTPAERRRFINTALGS